MSVATCRQVLVKCRAHEAHAGHHETATCEVMYHGLPWLSVKAFRVIKPYAMQLLKHAMVLLGQYTSLDHRAVLTDSLAALSAEVSGAEMPSAPGPLDPSQLQGGAPTPSAALHLVIAAAACVKLASH